MATETEQRVFVALINGSSQVLACKRAQTTNNGGQIGLPGGHANTGETPDETARRETAEEIGVMIDFTSVNTLKVRMDDQRILMIAHMPPSANYLFNLDHREVESVHWMAQHELGYIPTELQHKSVKMLTRYTNLVSLADLRMLLGSWK